VGRGHILICGAGVIGAATAEALTRRGERPTIVERVAPAAAASGRAGGFLALDWNDGGPVGPLARASFALHAALAERLGAERIGYRALETLMVGSADDLAVERYRQMANPAWLDGNVAAHSVIGTPATTAQVDPQRFTCALLEAAVEAGATLRTGTVEQVARNPDGSVSGVVVDGEILAADAVVLALGPWTTRVAAGLTLPLVHGLKGASITLEAETPAQAVFADHVRADGRRFTPEIYPRPDGVVYVNGYPSNAPLPDDPRDVHPDPGHCEELHRIAGVISRTLADAPVISHRACYRPVTIDGVPIIGPVPGAPGAYVATGHGPWGILNAPATGRMVAEMIVDGASTSLDARPFDPRRLPGARPQDGWVRS
jgi:glycine/D-amino acid oxidase-like deaminating enzyme